MDLLRMVLLLGGKGKPQLLPMEEQSIEYFNAEATTEGMTIDIIQLYFSEAEYTEEDTFTAQASVTDMSITLADAV